MTKAISSKNVLIIFAKEPVRGQVKTRLQKDLGVEQVYGLYKNFVYDVLNMGSRVQCDQRYVYYTGSRSVGRFVSRFARHYSFRRQQGKDLGERMERAFSREFAHGASRVVIIGTDCLTLTHSEINDAFDRLSRTDCVLGPTRDGGYYLIGLKAPIKGIFSGIKWSTDSVRRQTISKVRQKQKKVALLRNQEDIDTLASLRRFSSLKGQELVGALSRVFVRNILSAV